ncbi:hypothetical protein AFCDBAGC_4549 [Methylobacterium cerastii]|uniref:Uncharacterized protein n=1 Tax=Methylobacterium cerastii TaxID=932741 RepID=A0ABQ4QN23_9HYPH|nr:hypothetical protein AFCDBAGC_4549 [Methylobacterium cerastii]
MRDTLPGAHFLNQGFLNHDRPHLVQTVASEVCR